MTSAREFITSAQQNLDMLILSTVKRASDSADRFVHSGRTEDESINLQFALEDCMAASQAARNLTMAVSQLGTLASTNQSSDLTYQDGIKLAPAEVVS